ncbi:hypothetical protein RF11_07255 [Thelohanellus kitauei]|uniref:Uncharacterized protein n=1 Tax=Thelohanellus kitauei TaxID=669202 RepID=A0A0C2MZY6_THEKT|nr:hypothetical protein RF11_07255 [Thelohanellus kitauei]
MLPNLDAVFRNKDFYRLIDNDDHVIAFCFHNGLMASSRVCFKCQSSSRLEADNKISDEKIWRCPMQICRSKISIRYNSWFDKSNLPICTVFYILFGAIINWLSIFDSSKKWLRIIS